jgi:signal peptidase
MLLVVGQIIGQPVLLSFVETGSMSPTIETGDGFIAIPDMLFGSAEKGDVVVYQAQVIEGGGLTTHRIVGENNQGYITRGDANTFADQDSGEPPVMEPQIVAKALQINGYVVVIPQLGTAIEGTQSVLTTVQQRLAMLFGIPSLLGAQGIAYLFFISTLIWYIVGEWRDTKPKQRQRDRSRDVGTDTRLVVGAFTALLILSATVAMVAPAGTEEYEIVSAEFESDRPTVVPQGESETMVFPVDNGGVIPIVTYLEPASEGVEISPYESRVQPGKVVNASLTLQAPPDTGYYRRYVVEHRYLALLPTPVIRTLYAIHPWVPIVAIDALIGTPFYLFGIKLVGTGRIRKQTRNTELPIKARFGRLINKLY